jgi:hypothetical protein
MQQHHRPERFERLGLRGGHDAAHSDVSAAGRRDADRDDGGRPDLANSRGLTFAPSGLAWLSSARPTSTPERTSSTGTTYKPVTRKGAFIDDQIPSGFAPFNVLSSTLGVLRHLRQAGRRQARRRGLAPGTAPSICTTSTATCYRASSRAAPLHSPCGLAFAPDHFGNISDTLLVGGFSSHTLFFAGGPIRESRGVFGMLTLPMPTTTDGLREGANWRRASAGFRGRGVAP